MSSTGTWFDRRTSNRRDWPLELVLALKRERRVAVVLPARDEAATVGDIVRTIGRELAAPGRALVDDVVVVDSGSRDATAAVAGAAGARVVTAPRPGKGEAMWQGLLATDSDVVVFVDADLRRFDAGFVVALLGPLFADSPVEFVKAAYRRPAADTSRPASGGGRVTELVARPLLAAFWPELADVLQPLAGEYAATRRLLLSTPFRCGYGVDIGLLIDAVRLVGMEGVAQVDLGERFHRNSDLAVLGRMSAEVLHTVLDRAAVPVPRGGELRQPVDVDGVPLMWVQQVDVSERPPLVEPTAMALGSGRNV